MLREIRTAAGGLVMLSLIVVILVDAPSVGAGRYVGPLSTVDTTLAGIGPTVIGLVALGLLAVVGAGIASTLGDGR